jgi:hypothetical protein
LDLCRALSLLWIVFGLSGLLRELELKS